MRHHAEGDLTDQLVIDPVCMRLSVGLEALARLDTPTRDRLFGDTWPFMWGMRNRMAHGYLLVDTGIVRRTLQQSPGRAAGGRLQPLDGRWLGHYIPSHMASPIAMSSTHCGTLKRQSL
jgi:hypothetical protein